MTTPLERLRAWTEDLDLSRAELGRRLGCDPSAVSKIILGKRLPGRDLAVAIERETADLAGGAIKAADWSDAAHPSTVHPVAPAGESAS